jgi:hypothetical protein
MDHIRLAVSCEDPDNVVAEITRAMNLEFEARDSDFWGPYWLTEFPSGSLRVFLNSDPLYIPITDPPEDKWFEARFPDHAVLVDVDVERNERLCEEVPRLIQTAFPGSQIVDG